MAAAAMGAGIGLQMLGGLQASQAQASALQSEAQTARQNAATAQEQAKLEAENQVIQARKLLGEQKAGFASAGVGGESVYAAMADSMINAEMDRLNIIYGGEIRSRNFIAEARSKESASRDVKKSGLFQLAGQGLGAIGRIKGGG